MRLRVGPAPRVSIALCVITLVTLTVVLGAGPAVACSCGVGPDYKGPTPPEYDFTARAVEQLEPTTGPDGVHPDTRQVWRFEPTSVKRGKPPSPVVVRISVSPLVPGDGRTTMSGCGGGPEVQPGGIYRILARRSTIDSDPSGTLSADPACDITKHELVTPAPTTTAALPVSDPDALPFASPLAEGVVAVEEEGGTNPLAVAGAVGGLAALVLGALALRSRRREPAG